MTLLISNTVAAILENSHNSLLVDLIFPTKGTLISPYLIAGITLTYLGVAANGQSRLSRLSRR